MGKLCAVPISAGNLGGMTSQAIRILKKTDLVLAEDIRTPEILLKHFEIENAIQFHHKFSEHKTVESVVNRVRNGEIVVLTSDIDTPRISDPGSSVARERVRNGIEVQCLSGATTFVLASVTSGLLNKKLCFESLLPQKKGRTIHLKRLAEEHRIMVFYELPHRLVKASTQFSEHFGTKWQAPVSCEISKIHEEMIQGTFTELVEHLTANGPRDEIVIVVAGIDD